jgi:hypothetical protein
MSLSANAEYTNRAVASPALLVGAVLIAVALGGCSGGSTSKGPGSRSNAGSGATGSSGGAPSSGNAASDGGAAGGGSSRGFASDGGAASVDGAGSSGGGVASSGGADSSGGGPAGSVGDAGTDGAFADASGGNAGGTGSVTDGGMVTGWGTIHNDFFWYDQDGNLINTRSGCLRQFGDTYYWYGGAPGAIDQTCYSSTDLVHWTYKGVVLQAAAEANRMDVLYNASTQTYVMFLKYDGDSAYLGIATSPTPDGQYTFQSQTLVDGYTIGDMSMYQDDDGQAYLAYVWWETGPNREHGIYRMSADYLTLAERVYLWNVPSREAPHIFKRNGIYYYGTSRTAGINPTATEYAMATNLAGPWSAPITLDTPGSVTSYETQCDFVFPFAGTQGTYYMYDGDRWIPTGGSQGGYVWLPMEFDDAGVPSMTYYQDWDFNLASGAWRAFDRTRDLALGNAATASSEVAPNVAAGVTTATTYANYTATRWESAASDPQWIMVDLGSSMDVDRVILKWYSDYAKAFQIQGIHGRDGLDVRVHDNDRSLLFRHRRDLCEDVGAVRTHEWNREGHGQRVLFVCLHGSG